MADNIIHASETGLIVSGSPNVNAAYGPWLSVEDAKSALEEYFVTLDDNWQAVPKIPAGTTVAVYNSDRLDLVTEYWWVKNNLVLKTYGNNYYELIIKDSLDRPVNSIVIKDGFVEPEVLKVSCVDSSTGENVQFGRVNYSINGGDFNTYSFTSNGIPTNSIKTSIVFEWRDDEGRLVLFKDLNVIAPATITLYFYAYNNDTTHPDYDNDPDPTYYLNSLWTPNKDNLENEIWFTKRAGVSREKSIEWVISRTRLNGVWEPIEGPVISAAFGKDGANVTNLLYLWTYSVYGDQASNLKSTIAELNLKSDELADYYITKDSYGDSITWFSKFLSLTPENRYCYITHRYKLEIDGIMQWSSWTDPAIYTVYPLDGEDSPTTEYIYCQSDSEVLGGSEMSVFNWINLQYSTNLENDIVGGEIDFQSVNHWTPDPKGVSSTKRFEFAAIREKQIDLTGVCIYGTFSTPFIWAAFGKEGPDGPGLEYIYKLSSEQPELVKASGDEYQQSNYVPNDWSDDPLEVSYGNPILWMSQRKKVKGIWTDFTEPIIWNLFNLSYTLVLSNENCSIPASSDGSYTIEAAKAATATKVTLYLGSEDVTDLAEIFIDRYKYSADGDIYYLSEISNDFKDAVNVTFIAKIGGKQVASKFLTVLLNKGAESYMLLCIPNNRIWYGGNLYSATNFQLMLYKINTSGEYKQINNLSDFNYTYLFSNSETIILLKAHNNISIQGGESSAIYITLLNDSGKIIDSTTISCVDYSTIKGADNVSIIFGGIEKNIDISINKASEVEYIKNRTKSTPKAYINTIEIPSDRLDIKAELIYLDAIVSDPITVQRNGNTFWIEDPITADASIVYAIKVTMEDASELEYTVTLFLNLTADKISYDLYPDVNIITYGESGFSSDTINFKLVASEGEIPEYRINYRIGDIEGSITSTTLNYSFDLTDKIKNSISDGTYTLFFELYVLDVLKDTTSVTIISEPKLIGYTYTVDLDNSHLLIPVGTSGNLLETWSTSYFKVYLADKSISASDETYPNYSISVLGENSQYIKVDEIDKNKTYFTKLPNESTIIYYVITVHENASTLYEFIKSQRLLLVNDVAYQLVSIPDSVVTGYLSYGNFEFKPKVNKLSNNELTPVSDLNSEGLTIKVDGNPIDGLSTTINYSSTDDSVQISLYQGENIIDSDTIPIIRNGEPGADGISVKYVYGRCDKYISDLLLSDYNTINVNSGGITSYTKETFETFTDNLGIQWYDDPKGINSTYLLEFLSLSTYDGSIWSNFSLPIIHSEIGLKGEDGDGVLYFYTACLSIEYTPGVSYDITKSNTTYSGSLKANQSEDINLSGWEDNIPTLNRDNPKLYMILRKKINGKWSLFLNPVLWNTYHSELELVIDNNVVIIDDNSNNNTIKQVSTTNVKAYYLGSEISTEFTTSISKELASIVDIKWEGNKAYLVPKENQTLTPASGQITYSVEHEEVVVTASLQVLIKDFSAGEVYKLVLSPNVLPLNFENGRYRWDDVNISITALKISGKVSEDVTSSVNIELDGNPINISNKQYTITSGSSETTPLFTFSIKNEGVVVESQTLLGTLQGKDGKDGKDGQLGESGSTFRLMGEWNSTSQYYYKDGENEGDSYIDVVFVIELSKKIFYQTTKNSKGQQPAPNSGYWKEAPGYGTLLSENILISDGEAISGGMLNTATSNNTIMWAGGDGKDSDSSSSNAAFRVTRDGVLYASKGIFEGMYLSKVKQIDDFKISTRIIPEHVCFEATDGSHDGHLAVMPPILDISEISDSMIISNSSSINEYIDTGIYYPYYFLDLDELLTLEMIPLCIHGNLTIDLPNGIYVYPKDDYNSSTSSAYDEIIELYKILPVSSELVLVIDMNDDEGFIKYSFSYDFASISSDAFFSYMIYLAHCKHLNDYPSTPDDNKISIENVLRHLPSVILEYQSFKYTQALSYRNKTISITNAGNITGYSLEVLPSNKWERLTNNIMYLALEIMLKHRYEYGSADLPNSMITFTSYSLPIESNLVGVPPDGNNGTTLFGYMWYYVENGNKEELNLSDMNKAASVSVVHFYSRLDLFTIDDNNNEITGLNTDKIASNSSTATSPTNYGGIWQYNPDLASDFLIRDNKCYYFCDTDIIWFTKPLKYKNAVDVDIVYPQFYTSLNSSLKYSRVNSHYADSSFVGEFLSWKFVSRSSSSLNLTPTFDSKLGKIDQTIPLNSNTNTSE